MKKMKKKIFNFSFVYQKELKEELKGYMKLLDMNNFVQRIEWGAVYRLRW